MIDTKTFKDNLSNHDLSVIVDAFDCAPKIRVYRGVCGPEIAVVTMTGAVRMKGRYKGDKELREAIKSAAQAGLAYDNRVRELVREGMSRGDAQAIVDAEQDDYEARVADSIRQSGCPTGE